MIDSFLRRKYTIYTPLFLILYDETARSIILATQMR